MTFLETTLFVIAIYIVLVLVRVILGPTIWDRLLGLNAISAKIIMSIIILSLITGQSYLLDVALVYALLGFISTVLIARFIEKKGDIS
ncbi:monovalent cation/H+ antiporter complex subunit F [uncultured Acetobacterium sp.]|jgi:multicomponent Na+:H+ antiporter subunit F|uniref:monovalent cation/H+ antiporter complex subunit F n=1 Tax=uncultured Acetobacterium sp. TaxID=217139 RepID=UPI00242A0BAD|nr:monovalent cation/H+ antiporter complex subunit F [uncultured Acetobacterium sp.]MBU4540358.1 pH regulation protein F [Bacillota bacterium]